MGDGQEGLRLSDRYIGLDPLNAWAYGRKGEILFFLRRYPEAIEAGRNALAVAPHLPISHFITGFSLLLLRRPAEAMAEFRAMPTDDPFRLTGEALAAARTGNASATEQRMARLKQLYGDGTSYQCSEIHAQLGDRGRALAELENAVRAKDAGLIYLKVDPFLDPIRNDPGYTALLRRLNFP